MNLEHRELLADAKGLTAQHPYPSWVPSWKDNRFRLETVKYQWHPLVKTECSRYLEDLQNKGVSRDTIILISPASLYTERTPVEWDFGADRRFTIPTLDFTERLLEQAFETVAIQVNVKTGFLAVNLLHVMPFSSPPARTSSFKSSFEGTMLYWYQFNSKSCSLVFCTTSTELETTIPPGCNHLFLIRFIANTTFYCLCRRLITMATSD